MMYNVINQIDQLMKFNTVAAHCDIPCKIYDPGTAQLAVLSIIRFQDLIAELANKESLSISDQAQLARLVSEKERHGTKVKDEIRTIWGDYFKHPQLEAFPDTHVLVHSIMQSASACKQHIARETGEKLLALVNEFAASFWATKSIATYSAECPYPPNVLVIYPILN